MDHHLRKVGKEVNYKEVNYKEVIFWSWSFKDVTFTVGVFTVKDYEVTDGEFRQILLHTPERVWSTPPGLNTCLSGVLPFLSVFPSLLPWREVSRGQQGQWGEPPSFYTRLPSGSGGRGHSCFFLVNILWGALFCLDESWM